MNTNSKYYSIYINLISNAKVRNTDIEIYEVHHIKPKSLGGTNNKNNLVKLSPREHYVCHKLLTKFTEGVDRKKMVYALWSMTRSSKNHNRILNSHQYEYARNEFKKYHYLKTLSAEDKSNFYNKISEKTKGIERPWLKKAGDEWRDKVSRGEAQNPMTKVWKITHPCGKTETIANLAKFCREHNLSNGNLSSGKSKGYTAECLGRYLELSYMFH